MTRYVFTLIWYKIAYARALVTGHRGTDAPQYLLNAYNSQARAWNQWQVRRA